MLADDARVEAGCGDVTFSGTVDSVPATLRRSVQLDDQLQRRNDIRPRGRNPGSAREPDHRPWRVGLHRSRRHAGESSAMAMTPSRSTGCTPDPVSGRTARSPWPGRRRSRWTAAGSLSEAPSTLSRPRLPAHRRRRRPGHPARRRCGSAVSAGRFAGGRRRGPRDETECHHGDHGEIDGSVNSTESGFADKKDWSSTTR